MLHARYIPFALKQISRRVTRTVLTVGGVATAMFLFCVIQALQTGMREATEASASESTLVVYRENRFCPFTSKLPEHYEDRIARVPGVKSVLPMKISVSNCRASLDVITFRGVPAARFGASKGTQLKIVAGSLENWNARSDAALVGETLASRRGLKTGDAFDANGVTVSVAGIFESDEAQDKNTAYVHLDFLQRAGRGNAVGVVTEFLVKVDDPERLNGVAAAIDGEFKHDPDPTQTRSEKAFVARIAADLVELVRFTRWLGIGCVCAVLALVANTVVMSVQDRVREHAVLQTLGYPGHLIARLIVAEGALVSLAGGLLGAGAAFALLHFGRYSFSTEGININFSGGTALLLEGLGLSLALGILGGLVPALQASRRSIVESFRAV